MIQLKNVRINQSKRHCMIWQSMNFNVSEKNRALSPMQKAWRKSVQHVDVANEKAVFSVKNKIQQFQTIACFYRGLFLVAIKEIGMVFPDLAKEAEWVVFLFVRNVVMMSLH